MPILTAWGDIVKNGIDLRRDNIRGDVLHGGDAQGVLCGDGGDGRLGIQAVRRDGLDVGLNAGAPLESDPAMDRTAGTLLRSMFAPLFGRNQMGL